MAFASDTSKEKLFLPTRTIIYICLEQLIHKA